MAEEAKPLTESKVAEEVKAEVAEAEKEAKKIAEVNGEEVAETWLEEKFALIKSEVAAGKTETKAELTALKTWLEDRMAKFEKLLTPEAKAPDKASSEPTKEIPSLTLPKSEPEKAAEPEKAKESKGAEEEKPARRKRHII